MNKIVAAAMVFLILAQTAHAAIVEWDVNAIGTIGYGPSCSSMDCYVNPKFEIKR